MLESDRTWGSWVIDRNVYVWRRSCFVKLWTSYNRFCSIFLVSSDDGTWEDDEQERCTHGSL